jgi:lipoyl(octanoyl) transferase
MSGIFRFSESALDVGTLQRELRDDTCGGFAAFEGWVRNHNEGHAVTRLEYEAFTELAEKEGARIVNDAIARFGVTRAACIHRTGSLGIGDVAVWVGVSAPHRDEAFRACRFIIDEVKHRVPIWKKEHYVNGDSGWVNCERCATHGHNGDIPRFLANGDRPEEQASPHLPADAGKRGMSPATQEIGDEATPTVKWLGRVDYEPTWREMQRITDTRDASTRDEIWLLEHPPVFTLGLNADAGHVLAAGDIPVVKIDRGGQVTYHGPGQLVVYPLVDIRRAKLGVRDLVTAMERAVIDYCASLGVVAACKAGAPGVYVDGRKIASVGIRIRRGASYHGLAFNVNMDLEPFQRINPCGYAGLQMTQLADLGHPEATVERTGRDFAPFLERALEALRAGKDAALCASA